MDRDTLEARVLARLRKHASYDPLAWLPVIGSTRRDGARHGLAVELFGSRQRRPQIASLERALFQLAHERRIDVAQFGGPPVDGGPMPRQPRRQDDQTYRVLTLTSGSAGETFAVRLAQLRQPADHMRSGASMPSSESPVASVDAVT